MATAPLWRQLFLDSLEANKHLPFAKYFQLATVKQNGAPAVRTVVFRGFEEGSNRLLIITDSRSRKVDELKAWPLGEFVLYLTDSREQFRISGHLDWIGPESSQDRLAIRKSMWDSSPEKSLVAFAGPAPGEPVNEETPDPQLNKDAGPLDTFLIVSLEPTEVDYVNLRQNKRMRFEKEGSKGWTDQAVYP